MSPQAGLTPNPPKIPLFSLLVCGVCVERLCGAMLHILHPCPSCFQVIWQQLTDPPLSPPRLLFTPVCSTVMALLFSSKWNTSVPILWISKPLHDCRDVLFSCPTVQPWGNWAASILWGCYEGKQALDAMYWLSAVPLGSSETFHYATALWDQISPFQGQEIEKQHIFHLNLKEETKCNRINAKSMCLICHRSSAWCFDRALDFKKHPQRSVCIQGFWLSLRIYLYKAARAGAMPCVLGLNVDKWLDGYFSNLGCLLHSAQCQQTPSGKVMLF